MTWATPSAPALVVLMLGAYRLTRLAGWDTFAPAARAREWAQGIDAEGNITHQRPTWLIELFGCPFCLGFWISLALVATWWAWPTVALAVALPFAISGAVGLLAKNLDE